jgi:hypothetical protein
VTGSAARALADAIEDRFDSERALNALEARIRREPGLSDNERTLLLRRVAFYRGDFHDRRRDAERLERGLDEPR